MVFQGHFAHPCPSPGHGNCFLVVVAVQGVPPPPPTCFIQVHMTDNPYVIGHLTVNRANYQGGLHAHPADGDNKLEHLTLQVLWMFN